MAIHKHTFVESYDGPVGFGLDRETDEATIKFYLQKISDDQLIETLIPRLSDNELDELFDHMSRLLAGHLNEAEYHELFLK